MKVFRGIAYGIIGICVLLCIFILLYKGKNIDDEATPLAAVDSASEEVTVDADSEIGYKDLFNAASAIADDVKEEIKSVISSTSSDADSVSENKTGEIDYDTIVSLQEKEYEDTFRKVISDYNKKNGISVSSANSTSSSASVKKEYKYVVNKSTKVIHKIGCLLAPLEDNAIYYEKIKEADKEGYSKKCPVCSP